MGESIGGQVAAFLWMVAAGACIGFSFDFYRVLRGRLRPGPFGTWLGDLLFWLFATAVVFIFMWRSNFGDFRLYVLLGVAVGAFAYRALLSRAVVRLLATVWRVLAGILGLVISTVISVVRLLTRTLRGSWLFRATLRAFRRLREWAASDRRPPSRPPTFLRHGRKQK